jgi:predicted ArsR family transcriptional regulator
VARCAAALDLHENTARNHLEALADDGLANRSRKEANGRGRPSTLYAADAERSPDPAVREYAALASALARIIAETSDDMQRDADRAGALWGSQLAGGRRPQTRLQARGEIVDILSDLGFAPRANEPVTNVALTRCPLLDVARENTMVVCGVHRGLVRGALDQMGHGDQGAELFPFAEPGACRLLLAADRS